MSVESKRPHRPSLETHHAHRGSERNNAEWISGRYQIEGALGEGGMALVQRVRDADTGIKLALKRLTAKSPKLLALFQREYHTLASLRHSSIVKAFDYGSDALGPYYTMELLEGSDVSSLAPLPWPQVCQLVRDVAQGVALLHARRLLHRDLSARNVWRTPEGQIKLIDFGTMAAFGMAHDLVGTAPYVAPEALRGMEIDQRTDLYALGALIYYLLTGRHAFPARSLGQLETVWRERPRAASKRVAELGREDLPAVPVALDALVDSLLSQDALARPTTAADLIDRLSVIVGLPAEKPQRVLESYLSAPAFVGRAHERERLRGALDTALSGSATHVLVESSVGVGRSRLLAEIGLTARLAGATVLATEAHAGMGTNEVAQELSLRLLAALPAHARTLAEPYAATLGHVSSALRERLGIRSEQLAEMPATHGEARMRVQGALRDWFLDVARTHPLVILADDADGFDAGSAAWLAALSREAKAHKLLIVAAVCSERAPSLSLQALRQSAMVLPLGPLTLDEMLALFRSVFGDAQYLGRLVDRLYHASEGNPGHALDLAEHLSRAGSIAHVEGAWLLPQNVDEVALPRSRAEAEREKLARLPASARSIGQRLSVREGAIPLEMCAALGATEGAPLFAALEELVRAGVLLGAADGYRFARESLRALLQAELDPQAQRDAHRRLGRLLLSASDLSQLERLKAGVHLLLGGDDDEGSRVVALAGRHYGLVDLADLAAAVPSLELAVAHFRRVGRPEHELASVLAPLALAGYYADKRLATRYGFEAVDMLQRLVGLERARRLSRFVGRKLGLLLALLAAAVTFGVRAKNPRVPKFKEALMMLFNCVAALTGTSIVCLDLKAARRYAATLRPMTALGPDHVASFMYDFCNNLIGTIQDHPAQSRSRWIHMTERLDQPEAKRDLGDVHVLYLAGALYARGVGECRRDDSAAPALADRLQDFGLKLYDMSADQVRMIYHANRGDLEAFARYAEKVEVHAIQRGTAWQVEMWLQSSLMSIHLRTGDVAGLKDCAEQLKRISADMPSLAADHYRALMAYLVLRGTPEEALRVLDEHPEVSSEIIGWSRTQGVRARALNDLGRHAEACATCLGALEQLTDEDLAFCGNNLIVLNELARAEAGLGDVASAETRLRELIVELTPAANPVTLGTLHETLAELALVRDDRAAATRELAQVERWFRGTRHPALVARCDRLAKKLHADLEGEQPDAQLVDAHLVTVLHNLRHGGDTSLTGSAAWTLKQLSGLTELREAYLFAQTDGGDVETLASIAPGEHAATLHEWAKQQLKAQVEDLVTCTMDMDQLVDFSRVTLGERVYRLILLRAHPDDELALGGLVVPDNVQVPTPVVQQIASRLLSSGAQNTSA